MEGNYECSHCGYMDDIDAFKETERDDDGDIIGQCPECHRYSVLIERCEFCVPHKYCPMCGLGENENR